MKRCFLAVFIVIAVLAVCSCAETREFTKPAPAEKSPVATAEAPAPTEEDILPPPETPAPTPEITPEPDAIQSIIDGMTDEELVGQMVMCGFEGTSAPPAAFREFMQEYKVGNIILFGWNTETFDQTASLIERVKECNGTDIPLSFSIDVEGGSVLRFKWSPHISSAKTLGAKDDIEKTYEQYLRIGEQLSETGITIDLAPVLDIAENPSGTFLGKRMFGSDPEITVPHAQAAIKGLRDGGVRSFGKHYPGHGATATDSHSSLPVLNKTLDELNSYEFTMFRGAVEENIDGMLVGHLSYPEVDGENISSVSHRFITDILRDDMGFDGVVMSDDMRMQAIASTVGIGEGAVRFIEAGGDVVLIGKYINRQTEVFEAIYEALRTGRLTRARLENSVYRVLKMKGM